MQQSRIANIQIIGRILRNYLLIFSAHLLTLIENTLSTGGPVVLIVIIKLKIIITKNYLEKVNLSIALRLRFHQLFCLIVFIAFVSLNVTSLAVL